MYILTTYITHFKKQKNVNEKIGAGFSHYNVNTGEVATQRQLSNLSSSKLCLNVFFMIFIFEKYCSQRYVLSKRPVICGGRFLSSGNLSPGKQSLQKPRSVLSQHLLLGHCTLNL
jgi:hypothetical protein